MAEVTGVCTQSLFAHCGACKLCQVHDLRLRLEQELQRTKMEEEVGHVSRARVNQEVLYQGAKKDKNLG